MIAINVQQDSNKIKELRATLEKSDKLSADMVSELVVLRLVSVSIGGYIGILSRTP